MPLYVWSTVRADDATWSSAVLVTVGWILAAATVAIGVVEGVRARRSTSAGGTSVAVFLAWLAVPGVYLLLIANGIEVILGTGGVLPSFALLVGVVGGAALYLRAARRARIASGRPGMHD
jgi:hypothetical protein